MKTSFFTILTAVTTVAAFAPLSPKHQRLARIFSQVDEETKLEKVTKEALEEGDERTGPIENALEREVVTSDAVNSPPGMSTAIPFLKRPEFLDGSMPGDVGFDPFGFVDSEASLVSFREAEIKHARLAMLAAAGWPLSELFDRQFASWLDLDPALDATNRVPSILNGGLGKISPVYWGACLGAAAAIDLYGLRKKRSDPDYFPGKLGFDPLGLYPSTTTGKRRMELAEIKNGRLAMIAITGFAFQEFVQQYAVVDQTPLLFKPVSDVVETYGSIGGYGM